MPFMQGLLKQTEALQAVTATLPQRQASVHAQEQRFDARHWYIAYVGSNQACGHSRVDRVGESARIQQCTGFKGRCRQLA